MGLRMAETDSDAERAAIDLLKGAWRSERNSGARCLCDQCDQRASRGNRQPAMKARCFGNDRQPVAEHLVGNRISTCCFSTLEMDLTYQVAAMNQPCDDLSHQRRCHPAGRADRIVRAIPELVGDHHGCNTQTRSQAFCKACDVKATLWQKQGNRLGRRLEQKRVGVVFQQIAVVPPDDVRNFLPPFVGHRCAGWRLQRGHGEDRAGFCFSKGAIERIGQQPVFVAIHTVQPVSVLRRERDHTGIGEALGQHYAVGAGHHAHGNRETMLSAVGNEEMIGIGGHAELRKPSDHAVTVMRQTLMRQVAEQGLEHAIRNDVFEDRGDELILAGMWGYVERKVER